MSAHRKHTGPASSIIRSPPVPAHAVQVQSLTGETTTRSGGRLWRSASRLRADSDRPGDNQWIEYARSIAASPVTLKRSGRRSRVRATYSVSLGRNSRATAHPRNAAIAPEIFGRLAVITRSKQSTRPCRQRSTLPGGSQPRPVSTSIADTKPCAASAASATATTRPSTLSEARLPVTSTILAALERRRLTALPAVTFAAFRVPAEVPDMRHRLPRRRAEDRRRSSVVDLSREHAFSRAARLAITQHQPISDTPMTALCTNRSGGGA